MIGFVCHILVTSKHIVHAFDSLTKSMDSCINTELTKLNDISLEEFSIRLSEISCEDSYNNRMYILDRKYLIMFKININEMTPEILQEFYSQSPFIIIDIESIIQVKSNSIRTWNNYIFCDISFTMHISANWLRSKLRIINDRYQKLQQLIEEERELETKPESVYLTAIYRLNGPITISSDLMPNKCPICREDYQINLDSARWPCSFQHLFHFDCLINALRIIQTCPMCRHSIKSISINTSSN